jgi:predicted aspartyl protease
MAFEPAASRRLVLTGLAAAALAPARAVAQAASEPPEVLEGRTDWTRRLTTPVKIDGQGPFRFIIDTGANRSVISDQVARRLALPEGAPTLVHGIAGAVPARTVNVKSFLAGGAPAPIKDIPVLDGAALGAEGLLGIDAFRNRRVEFDFVRGRVTLSHAIAPNEPSTGSFSARSATWPCGG